jgi:hypothetical protein
VCVGFGLHFGSAFTFFVGETFCSVANKFLALSGAEKDLLKTMSLAVVSCPYRFLLAPSSGRSVDPSREMPTNLPRARARQEHYGVVACGECSPVLWVEGKAGAAIRLEQLWDEVGKTFGVDILCGYALSSFHGEEDEHVFQSICAEHSAVYSQ